MRNKIILTIFLIGLISSVIYALGVPSIAPIKAFIANGLQQAIVINTTIPSSDVGVPPYTYNFLVFNSVTNSIVGNFLDKCVVRTSDIYYFPFTQSMNGNTLQANVAVTDSATPTSPGSCINLFANNDITSNLLGNVIGSNTASFSTATATSYTGNILGSSLSSNVATNSINANFIITNSINGINTLTFNALGGSNIIGVNIIQYQNGNFYSQGTLLFTSGNAVKENDSSEWQIYFEIAVPKGVTDTFAYKMNTMLNGITNLNVFNTIITAPSGAGETLNETIPVEVPYGFNVAFDYSAGIVKSANIIKLR